MKGRNIAILVLVAALATGGTTAYFTKGSGVRDTRDLLVNVQQQLGGEVKEVEDVPQAVKALRDQVAKLKADAEALKKAHDQQVAELQQKLAEAQKGLQSPPTPVLAKSEPPGPDPFKGQKLGFQYGSDQELFKVEGTPKGFKHDGVNNVSMAERCKREFGGTLKRAEDSCRKVELTGQIECKNVCVKPDGTVIGKATFN